MTRVALPATPLCAAATEYAHRAYEPFLRNHVMRSFLFADALGRRIGAPYDRELLYVACVLHDLGLGARAPAHTRFEVEGADEARVFLASRGVCAERQEIVWDAIALHTTPVIPQRKRPEIALCQSGAGIDVGFVPRDAIPGDDVEAALEAYPRLAFKTAMVDALCGLLRRGPEGAATSPVVAAAGERRVEGFSTPHFCDVLARATFDE